MKNIIIKYLWIGIIMLCIFILAGCGQVPMADRVLEQHQAREETSTSSEVETIGNMESIGVALGCVFAPQNCQKSK
jgi:ABC-type bacteriocin/lantibiotic exporter with double-glycine peptidase domain